MKRRDFFKSSSSMMLPIVLGGFGMKSLNGGSSLVHSLNQTAALESDRVLVIIYLGGGNDGLNTVIPLENYPQYYSLRSNIAIPESKVLRLDAFSQVGLHPSMIGLKSLFDEGKLAIVNSVSYPNPDQSHYRSTDIWMTGASSDKSVTSGWAGRYLNDRYQGYPEGYPNDQMSDPLAVQIGQIGTTALLGNVQSMGITLKDPNSFYQLVGEAGPSIDSSLPCCDAGELLKYIRQKQVLATGYASRIKQAADAGRNMAEYPDSSKKNELAEQLKIVARLIHGGLKSKIFYVELGGFDTHSGQVENDTTTGMHAELLRKLSDGISSFQNDLKMQGNEDKVLGLTFSDFGRRATSNASKGTDHGVGAPMFVFGSGIKRQIVGTSPDLINGLLPTSPGLGVSNRDIKMQIDFRRIYADVLRDWFRVEKSNVDRLLFNNFPTTSLFSDTIRSVKSGTWSDPESWSHGQVPSVKDQVAISAGHLINADRQIAVKNVKVEATGELHFPGDFNVSLQ